MKYFEYVKPYYWKQTGNIIVTGVTNSMIIFHAEVLERKCDRCDPYSFQYCSTSLSYKKWFILSKYCKKYSESYGSKKEEDIQNHEDKLFMKT